ncbi:RNA polymerase I, second largest subunit [Trachipleistophora hominis]|uniref:DNA-directed RNA polymerase subunit beta n=1 Tax=Trachipleistophora hominis TaxID=72359 RepID=L7JTN3_TRAHO|nr:RNA polymerase I, second largest subunit [Trachipleistophora hominis]
MIRVGGSDKGSDKDGVNDKYGVNKGIEGGNEGGSDKDGVNDNTPTINTSTNTSITTPTINTNPTNTTNSYPLNTPIKRTLTAAEVLKKLRFNIDKCAELFLATGTLKIRTNDLLQTTGLSILAERINTYRFLSHFESINRGAFFAVLKTTGVRALRPESFGFLCPVHTPDGAPCGLIVHMAMDAIVGRDEELKIAGCVMGDRPLIVDGRVVGYVDGWFGEYLRRRRRMEGWCVEIVDRWDAVYVFGGAGRLMRRVVDGGVEVYVGVMEQVDAVVLGYEDDCSRGRESNNGEDDCSRGREGKGRESRNREGNNGESRDRESNNGEDDCIGESNNGDSDCGRKDRDIAHKQNKNKNKNNLKNVNAHKNERYKRNENNNSRGKNTEHSYDNDHSNVINKISEGINNTSINNTNTKNNIDNNIKGTSINNTNTKNIKNIKMPVYKERPNARFFSYVASTIPFADYNQSPRNMYQCQMAKQAMAYPTLTYNNRTDSKYYVLNNMQRPLIKTFLDTLLGTNVYIAVLSYTSYDMEDAMVINKCAIERGLFDGYVYVTKVIERTHALVLPDVGEELTHGCVLYVKDGESVPYTGECARVHCVRLTDALAIITLRVRRSPQIGDKFCSRHGQKGVLSYRYRAVDLPFNEHGMVPDLIINPHAFPSRMTVGMMMEMLAGTVAVIKGERYACPPFKTYGVKNEHDVENDLGRNIKNDLSRNVKNYLDKNVENDLGRNIKNDLDRNVENDLHKNVKHRMNNHTHEHFCEQLRALGLNYYGNETLYSGITGHKLHARVFTGMCYYQRLRHMVSDKWQVRSVGPVQAQTRQPIKGRKRGGGVRFGEMERDALIAHGCAYLLYDRLMECSDKTAFEYCERCKTFLFVRDGTCLCGCRCVKVVYLPYVFKYLCTELMGMNIFVEVDVGR